jgi:hypothetical protein
MIVFKHVLVCAEVYRSKRGQKLFTKSHKRGKGFFTELEREEGILTELVVILSELTVANGAILVDDAADLNNTRHARRVATELDHLDLTV